MKGGSSNFARDRQIAESSHGPTATLFGAPAVSPKSCNVLPYQVVSLHFQQQQFPKYISAISSDLIEASISSAPISASRHLQLLYPPWIRPRKLTSTSPERPLVARNAHLVSGRTNYGSAVGQIPSQ